MKRKRPIKEIARAKALYRQFKKADDAEYALYAVQERLRERRRKARDRYALAKAHVDALMFDRHLGSAKLPKVGY